MLPRCRFLDTRSASEASARPIASAVNIPLAELDARTHELPPRGKTILVAHIGTEALRSVERLRELGRSADLNDTFDFGDTSTGRLWEPNAFLYELMPLLAPGRVLDLACGSGRDAVALAACGWHVTAMDLLPDALERGMDLQRRYAPSGEIRWIRADLEGQLPIFEGEFDLITMFFFLHRPLLEAARQWLSPGGSLVVETFTREHRERFGKPRREALVLQPGELADLGLEVVRYDEGLHGERYTARFVGRRED